MLTDEQISNFQKLHKKHFGKTISRKDAYEQGINLLRLMSLVYQPMTKDEFNFVQERRRETSDLNC